MPAAVEHVRRALRNTAIRVPDVFLPGTRLVVGYSGGQDSTCLLHGLAHSHRKLDLCAVHIDHGLRADSAEDARRVVALGEMIGVETRVFRVNVPRGRSVQQAARTARYAALGEAAHQHNARAVLVAHTADDQAETVLLNLLRGSGLLGLAAMRVDEQRPGAARLVRPLLRVSRATTLAYCQHFGLDIVEDASNHSRAYTRNRVRLDLLPLLEQFNPTIRGVLARTADLAVEDNTVLDNLATNLYDQLRGDHTYDLRGFRAQPRALQRRLLRLAIQGILSGLVDVTDAPVEDALDLLQTGHANQTYHLPYGVELLVRTDVFTLRQAGGARQRLQKNLDAAVPRV